jgi:4-carboxymuconolactone decarboxylase
MFESRREKRMRSDVRTIQGVIALSAMISFAFAEESTPYEELTWPVTEKEFVASLPDDVYPDSRGRIPLVRREDLDEEGKSGYDARIAPDTKSRGKLQGPGGLTLNGTRDLTQTLVDARTQELARLVVSREMDQRFEWTLHEPVALQAGLEPEIIDVIRYRRPLDGVPERDAAIIRMGRELFQNHKVSSGTFATVVKHLGKRDLVDLCRLMGNYTRTAILLHTFDVHLPYDREPLLPVP